MVANSHIKKNFEPEDSSNGPNMSPKVFWTLMTITTTTEDLVPASELRPGLKLWTSAPWALETSLLDTNNNHLIHWFCNILLSVHEVIQTDFLTTSSCCDDLKLSWYGGIVLCSAVLIRLFLTSVINSHTTNCFTVQNKLKHCSNTQFCFTQSQKDCEAIPCGGKEYTFVQNKLKLHFFYFFFLPTAPNYNLNHES